jgi:hypothetical protein
MRAHAHLWARLGPCCKTGAPMYACSKHAELKQPSQPRPT